MRKFHYAEFQVEWLGVGGKLQMRVTRKLASQPSLTNLLQDGRLPNIIRWWYGTSVALDMFCARYSFPASLLQGASFHAVLRECYEHSEMRGLYDFGLFLDFWIRESSVNIDEIIPREIWHDKNYIGRKRKKSYIETRCMGCPYLGKSVFEVLGTLICAIQGTEFCDFYCEHCNLARSQLR